MKQEDAIEVFAALAQPTRISVFRLLVQVGPAGLPALEIARRLDVVASTLSGHLSILKRSGILTATRHQREIHYAANLSAVNELICVPAGGLLRWPGQQLQRHPVVVGHRRIWISVPRPQ